LQFFWLLPLHGPGQTHTAESAPAGIGNGFRPSATLWLKLPDEHFYNMDYDRSIPGVSEGPGPAAERSVRGKNHLLSAVLMRELYRMGAMNTGEYANDSFIGASPPHCRP
jgi:hypothetical protein